LECDEYYICEEFYADDGVAYGISSNRPNAVFVTEKKEKKNHNSYAATVVVSRGFQKDCLDSNLYQNWDICRGHCNPYECCFRAQGSCYAEQKLECDEYYICEEFYADDGVEDADATAALDFSRGDNQQVSPLFNDDCMQDNLYANWDVCKNHCTNYKCCFDSEEGGSCYDDRMMECEAYFICKEFSADEDEGVGTTQEQWERENPQETLSNQATVAPKSQGVNDHTSAGVNADLKNAVHAVCNPGDGNSGESMILTACQALCSNYLCCFSHGTANCRNAVGGDVCDAYQECSVLQKGK